MKNIGKCNHEHDKQLKTPNTLENAILLFYIAVLPNEENYIPPYMNRLIGSARRDISYSFRSLFFWGGTKQY